MAFEHKNGFGSLFVNKDKSEDKHPNYRGNFMHDGQLFEIAGWKKTTTDGEPFVSLSVKPKEAPPAQSQGGSNDAEAFF